MSHFRSLTVAATSRPHLQVVSHAAPCGIAVAARPKHVIFLANGLYGVPSNWHTIVQELESRMDSSEVLVHASHSNTRLETFDGIDKCGERLADEMRSVVAQHPSLERVSVIGHSMGGLLLRYATATLFNPEASTIAGLAPAHFITMATPHLGCDGAGVAQVPFIGWAGALTPFLRWISVPTAATLFKRTGLQFFRADGSEVQGTEAKPLLLRMTEDDPECGLYFYSALKSFTSRTAYANTGHDHLVGWTNSSLRFAHELPQLPELDTGAKGVVLEDDIMTAFEIPSRPEAAEDEQPQPSGRDSTTAVVEGSETDAHTVTVMLQRLQQLPWRRIDVSFKGSPLSIMSHNHIQARWTWLNMNGRSVAIHLADELVQLEETGRRLQLIKEGRGSSLSTLSIQPIMAVHDQAAADGDDAEGELLEVLKEAKDEVESDHHSVDDPLSYEMTLR